MKWEYLIISIHVHDLKNRGQSAQELGRLGGLGWEAVSAWSETNDLESYVLLKREISK
jgi:hypothetical protein